MKKNTSRTSSLYSICIEIQELQGSWFGGWILSKIKMNRRKTDVELSLGAFPSNVRDKVINIRKTLVDETRIKIPKCCAQ